MQEQEDCQIVEPTNKDRSGSSKKKAPSKKRVRKVKVEEEEDTEEKKKNWPNSDVEQ